MTDQTAFAASPEQRRAWALDPHGVHLGHQVRIAAVGPVTEAELRAAIAEVVAAHEVLRTEVVEVAGQQAQVIGATAAARWDVRSTGPGAWEIRIGLPADIADRQTAALLLDALADAHAGAARRSDTQYADVAAWLEDVLAAEPARDRLRLVTAGLLDGALPYETRGRAIGPVRATTRPLAADPGDAVLLACWQALLGRITRANPVVAVAVSGRQRPDLAAVLGPLTRAVPVPAALGRTVAERVEATRAALADAVADVPAFAWPTTPEPGWLDGVLPHSPFGYAGERWPAPRDVADVRFALVEVTGRTERHTVELGVVRRDGETTLELRHDTAAVPDDYADALLAQYATLLAAAVADPRRAIDDLPLLDAAMADALLRAGVAEPAAGADDDVLDALRAHTVRAPDAVAVIDGDRTLTYADLVGRVAALAGSLAAAGVGAGDPVAVSVPRGADAVIAALAVLWAGGAYAPVDEANPVARTEAMLRALAPRAVLADVVARGGEPLRAPRPAASEQAVFVIHTSGSAGVPRPVAVPHRALRNRLSWGAAITPLRPADRVLQAAALGFDFSVWEILAPLAAGAAIVVADDATYQQPRALAALLRDRSVTVAHFTPALLDLVAAEPDFAACSALRLVLSGGAALTPETVRRVTAATTAELFNQYGPTEAAIDVTRWRCVEDAPTVPIGHPAPGCAVHVLGPDLWPTPVGVPGEIYLGGAALGTGYLGMPAETAARFVADPHAAGARMYRTGDAGRVRPDGAVECLGRLDDEVGLRGYRVHLGEVEAALRAHPAVASAAAAVRDVGGVSRLIGYVVPAREPLGDVRGHVTGLLPGYMVPAQVVSVAALPLTPAGKVDRAALPDPGGTAARAPYRAPVTDVERVLCRLWLARLRDQVGSAVDRVGRDDDFFELGGHSLISLGLLADVRDVLGVEVPLVRLVPATTVAAMADVVAECEPTPGHAAKVARVWLRVAALSDEEAAGLLAATAGPAPAGAAQ